MKKASIVLACTILMAISLSGYVYAGGEALKILYMLIVACNQIPRLGHTFGAVLQLDIV